MCSEKLIISRFVLLIWYIFLYSLCFLCCRILVFYTFSHTFCFFLSLFIDLLDCSDTNAFQKCLNCNVIGRRGTDGFKFNFYINWVIFPNLNLLYLFWYSFSVIDECSHAELLFYGFVHLKGSYLLTYVLILLLLLYEILRMLSGRSIHGLSNILRRCYAAAAETAQNVAKEAPAVNAEELRLTFASPVEV